MTMFQVGGAIYAGAKTKLKLARSCLADNKVLPFFYAPAKAQCAASRHHWGVQYGRHLKILSWSCQLWHKTRRCCVLLLIIFMLHSLSLVVPQPWILLEEQSSAIIDQSVLLAKPAALQAVLICFSKAYSFLFVLLPCCFAGPCLSFAELVRCPSISLTCKPPAEQFAVPRPQVMHAAAHADDIS